MGILPRTSTSALPSAAHSTAGGARSAPPTSPLLLRAGTMAARPLSVDGRAAVVPWLGFCALLSARQLPDIRSSAGWRSVCAMIGNHRGQVMALVWPFSSRGPSALSKLYTEGAGYPGSPGCNAVIPHAKWHVQVLQCVVLECTVLYRRRPAWGT